MDGLLDGEGILRQADGVRFKGTFSKGLKEGKGILEDADGIRYEGNFSQDKKNGVFIEKDKSGLLIRKVVYQNGVPVTAGSDNN